MQLMLKVVGGTHAGKEIKVPVPKFIVGRAPDCHLRPQSDLISRHHCAFLVGDDQVTLEDFGSRNGTYINAERLSGKRELKNGDRLQIGPLHFEVQLVGVPASKRKPRVQDVKDVATRTAEAAQSGDLDIGQWLSEADEVARTSDTRRLDAGETEYLRKAAAEAVTQTPPPPTEGAKDGKAKKLPGKLPAVPAGPVGKDSSDAAAETLKKLFRGGR